MPIYTIIAPDDSTLTDQDIASLFPGKTIPIRSNAAWMVQTGTPTCADVRDKIRDTSAPTTCVVVKATVYNGYSKRSMWEKLEAWERE